VIARPALRPPTSAARRRVSRDNTNRYKFFAEVGGTWQSGTDEWLLNGDGEARLIRGGWVSFSAGLASTSDRTDLRTNLALKIGALGL
jgi:hypothetical protein